MKFNEQWTKEDNDLLRTFNKEHKSFKYIKEYFGMEKLKQHPNKKFNFGKCIMPYSNFMINIPNAVYEMIVNPKHTIYKIEMKKSLSYENKNDYLLRFVVNNHNYILIFFYYIDKKIESYNLLFTTENLYIEYETELNKIISSGKKQLTDEDNDYLASILEMKTNHNEVIPLFKSLSYILFDFYYNISPILLSINETKIPVKIEFYRKLIKDSFEDVSEIKAKDNFNKNIYYYKIKLKKND